MEFGNGFQWDKTELIENGKRIAAVAPVIISASRATDIPACYPEWFMNRLKAGHVAWKNPFNGAVQHVSFAKTRAIVFWTKDARPLMKYLSEIDRLGFSYYFQFTLNDYEQKYEPGLPPLEKRLETFRELSRLIGKQRVIWRFDPLMITDTISLDELIKRVIRTGDQLRDYAEKLVFSFVDIGRYPRVKAHFKKANIIARELSEAEMLRFAGEVSEHCRHNWGIQLATCAEKINLAGFGIDHNKCVDDALLRRCFPDDAELMSFLGSGKNLKDPGQRKECGCVRSKDIGAYNTCGHGCVYCYAGHARNPKNERPINTDKH